MANRRLPGSLTLKDGEEVFKTLIVFPEKSKLRNSFSLAMSEGFIELAKLDLTRHEYRVLLALIGEMDYGNWVGVTQQHISETIGIPQPHVSKAVKSLKDKGLVFKEKTAKGQQLRVSSVIAWKGRPDHEFRVSYLKDSEFFALPN